MIFTRADWDRLATLFYGVVREGELLAPPEPYSGYKPGTFEAPNGDTKVCPTCTNGVQSVGMTAFNPSGLRTCEACRGTGRVPNVDAQKKYLHVADKYTDAPAWARAYHDRAYAHACRVANALGVPAVYYPRPEFGALRVLEYPPGAGGAEHTDFDLFSVVCWRETPADLERVPPNASTPGLFAHVATRREAEALSPGLHIGEIGELVGLGPATPHRVPARPYVQRSIVYFAIPDHAAFLPRIVPEPSWAMGRPVTVGAWLAERMARSRYEASR